MTPLKPSYNRLNVSRTKALEQLWRRGYEDFGFFARTFFPHHCSRPFSPMHEAFCLAEAQPRRRGRREAIAAPRGHAKTTLKLLIKAIHAIVYRTERFILVIGQSAPEAEDKVAQILAELQTNRLLLAVFGALTPTGSRKKFVTTSGIRVQARSRGQQVRGIKHGADRPTLILCDDIETLEGVQTPEQRAKTRDWFFKDVLKCGQTDGTSNFIFIGTCLHPESLLSELLATPGWQARKYQAILEFAQNQPLWQQWKALFTDLSRPAEDAEAFYHAHEAALLAGSQVLWPEGESYLSLMKQLVSEGEAAFYSEKMNEPYDPSRQLFDLSRARRFDILIDSQGRFAGVRTDTQREVGLQNFERIIAFHDPALGEKPGQSKPPDYAAMVVVGKDRAGYLYVLDCYLKRSKPSEQVAAALALAHRWAVDALYLETNHFQELLKPLFAEAQTRAGSAVRIVGVHQHENKIQRIATLEPDIHNGHLLFATTLDPKLLQQLQLFPTTHDDGPDALQGAVSQLKKRHGGGIFVHPSTRGYF